MNIIKLGLISLIVFALIITGFSLFLPSRVRVSKAIDITAEFDSLKLYLSDASLWKSWYPGADTLDYYQTNGKITGLENNAGGKIEITEATDSTVLASTSGPGIKKMVSGWNIYPAGRPNSYTIQWYMDFRLGWFPWDKFSGMLLEKRYGPVMEQALDKLKVELEN